MIPVYIQCFNCQCIPALFENWGTSMSKYTEQIPYVFLLSVGIILSIVGARKMTWSLFLVLLCGIESFFEKIRNCIQESTIKGDLNSSLQPVFSYLNNVMINYSLSICICSLIVSLLLSGLLVFSAEWLSIAGFIAVTLYFYNIAIHTNIVNATTLTETLIFVGIFVIFAVLLGFFVKKAYNITMCILFGIIGPLFSAYAIEKIFNLNLGFKILMEKESNPLLKISTSIIYYFLELCAFLFHLINVFTPFEKNK